MKNNIIGAVLAVAIVVMAAFALPVASGDSPDVREAELYAGSAFAYTPSGDWTDAKASGTALDAGMAWKNGTLSGTIDVPGTYRVSIVKDEASFGIELTVLPIVTVNGKTGGTILGDAIVVSGAKEGAVVCPVTVGGPDGTDVSAECDRGLFAFDAEKGFVLIRDAADIDAGTYTLTVKAVHESGPLYAETCLKINVEILKASQAVGLDASELASFGTRSGSTTYVLTAEKSVTISNPSYAAPEDPAVSDLDISSDGRSVRVSSSVTDAEEIVYNWGDGTRTVVQAESVLNQAHHTYRQGGTYSVVVSAIGPYSSGYAVAVFDTPADVPEKSEGHGWVFILFAVLALIAILAFAYCRDMRMVIAAVVFVLLAIASYLMRVGA